MPPTATAIAVQQPPNTFSSDSDYDSDPTSTSSGQSLRHVDLSTTVFKAYIETNGHQNSDPNLDLSKIQSFLVSSSSGALSCLICLERIRPHDPTWSCSALCFSVFHLQCIQSWGQQSSSLSASRALTRLPISADRAEEASVWSCPKCRSDYPKTLIPKLYLCYCGKLENPPHDPWILPHSCGEICRRALKNNCGHDCLLLCHPGPCPSCPKLVKTRCYCGAVEDMRRCGFKEFSCKSRCNKLLSCGNHSCSETCHEGDCPPCRKKGVYRCQCGKVEEERECFEREFRCESPCEKVLGCGKHTCNRGCHGGKCGECPMQGRRTCPCEKKAYEGMACDVDAPLCGSTCEKKLSCGVHRCPERCHRGPCLYTCRSMATKSCRCGGLRKQSRYLVIKNCYVKGSNGTVGDMLAGGGAVMGTALLVCGRKLRCRNHKCPSPCHRGPCAPCPLMVTISCACGHTRYEVPCGTEALQKPPRCRKLCHIPRLCRHSSITKPHKCHYGACPPCRLPCGEEYPCSHTCRLECHGPKPPPNPEYTLKPKKKKSNYQSEPTPGTPCPPCPELIWRSCRGQHIGAERMMVCSKSAAFSCDNLCGNSLACGNHFCTKTCHALKSLSPSAGQGRGESCEVCNLPCDKERSSTCPHSCPLRCHPGECPPCKALVKRGCHCGAMVHVLECMHYNTLSKDEQIRVRTCNGPCHRKLPNCTHLCPEICHPGECPSPNKCIKKVGVRCRCHNLKKEWLCQDVQAAYRKDGREPKDIPKSQFGVGLLPCNSDCKSKLQVIESELQLRKPKALEMKIDSENTNPVKKRRKRRDLAQETKQVSLFQKIIAALWQFFLIVTILVTMIAAAYFGYKGLFFLNDWMNEAEKLCRDVKLFIRKEGNNNKLNWLQEFSFLKFRDSSQEPSLYWVKN
ncbi:LOW QUALITY PROTEIN: hypothetical protein V2J09_012514 [Rumex salicifolius]